MNIHKKTLEFYDKNCLHIDTIYAEKLFNEISKIMPIKDKCNNILFNNGDVFIENKFIKQVLGNEKKVISDKNEIFNFINKLRIQLEVKLYNLVLQNPIGYLVSLYSMLDYNCQFTPLLMETINKKLDANEFKDENIKIFANSINFVRKNVNEEHFKNLLIHVENIIATDKQALQKIINYILSYKMEFSNLNIQAIIEVEDIIELARSIYFTLSIKQEIFSNIERTKLIVSKGKIVISSETQILSTITGDFYDLLSNSFPSNFEFDTDVNKIMRETLGVDSDIINTAITKHIEEEIHYPGMMFFDKEGLLNFLTDFFIIDANNAKKIYKELVLDGFNLTKIPSDVSLNEGRLLRQSILKLDKDLYICTEAIFIFSLGGILADISDGKISNEILKKELFKYIHEMHLDFEKKVASLIIENFSYELVESNLPENFFTEFELPGEIDIIILKQGVLFVLECKAFSLKSNLNDMLNEVKKVKSTNYKKSIQQKLKSKIDILEKNRHFLENKFGFKIDKFEGIIVTKHPSFAQNASMGFFDVIHSSQVNEYLNNYFIKKLTK